MSKLSEEVGKGRIQWQSLQIPCEGALWFSRDLGKLFGSCTQQEHFLFRFNVLSIGIPTG